MKKKILNTAWIALAVFLFANTGHAQYRPDLNDFGKMWPFEHAPADYLSRTYDFNPNQEWLDGVRMSSLLFGNWCSASFISGEGLILTNHHCSRMVLEGIMEEGEDFDANGFYAETMDGERKAPGLWVRQLVKIMDVSDRVAAATKGALTDEEMITVRDSALNKIMEEVTELEEWSGLEVEPVFYYSGVKISLYGYKRYNDIRLVLIPELQAAYFGGDPDNFTYPRYNLDFTLWRAYENGEPVNSSSFYYPVNTNGIHPGEPIFVVGNPGSTERYRTMAQYIYDRDYRYQIQLDWMKTNYRELEKEYEKTGDRMLQEQMFMFSNSIKAFQGILEGMHNTSLMNRKQEMEDYIRERVAGSTEADYWKQLAEEYHKLEDEMMEVLLLNPQSGVSSVLMLAYALDAYVDVLNSGNADSSDLSEIRGVMTEISGALSEPSELTGLTNLLVFLDRYADEDDAYVQEILEGEDPVTAASRILSETLFANDKKLEKFLKWDARKIDRNDDPVLKMSRLLVPEYIHASGVMSSNVATRRALENKIAREMYGVFGLKLPPDATGTLRISDGRVQGYTYNGTEAPYQTTFFGMYDRYYSNDRQFPWDIPASWENPPVELLSQPLNFVSTVDITGGNSGSPMINRNRELVGLVFDGNIESLPGNFIYDEEYNRGVGVHAAGIVAALRLIYGADRLVKEMIKE